MKGSSSISESGPMARSKRPNISLLNREEPYPPGQAGRGWRRPRDGWDTGARQRNKVGVLEDERRDARSRRQQRWMPGLGASQR